MAQHPLQQTLRSATALLCVLTLLFTLFPLLDASAVAAATDRVTLSKSVFSVGYATASVSVEGSDTFPFKSDTKVSLFDQNGVTMKVIADVSVRDAKHLSFTLQPGLHEGRYSLMIASYDTMTIDLNVMTTYDPTNLSITPGVDRDFRIDWTDPSDLLSSDIVINYGPVDQQYYPFSTTVHHGVGTATVRLPLSQYELKKGFKFQIYANNANAKKLVFDNSGRGYLPVDTTPPGDIKNIVVNNVSNGFSINWTNPQDDDLDLITVQVAEHGTTSWSDGFVVKNPSNSTVIQPLNLAKRYDLRFTKTDKYGNWAYQVDNHNGYGYTLDTKAPDQVKNLTATNQSETSAYITWYDPQPANNPDTTSDFHHVNLYLKSSLTDWKQVGRVDKGVQAYTLTGLSPYIDYTLKATAVDSHGNESSGTISNPFHIGNKTDVDRTNLKTVDISQEAEGGLLMKWTSDSLASVDFSQFKMYYVPANLYNIQPSDYKETVLSNKGVKSASLRAMPKGTYYLQMRAYDSYGLEQDLSTYKGTGYNTDGFYVSGTSNGLPTDVSQVRIQPNNGKEMIVTWNAASSTGTHVSLYYAERSSSPYWKFLGKVDKRDQRYTVTGLSPKNDYFFKLVAYDDKTKTESPGLIYDNTGYGYNLLNGDTHPPGEVTDASATVSLNTLNVTYAEPRDPDFDKVNIYAQKVGSTDAPSVTSAGRGSNGIALRDMLPGASYTLRLTTIDIYGNESAGVSLTNNSQGYTISGGPTVSINEVRNALVIPDTNKLTVRFLDPLANDYQMAYVSIKKRTDSGYGSTQTVNKSSQNNEVTFYNLESNQQYQVRIVAVNTSGKQSSGVNLGGDTGIALLPISSVATPLVTPGNNHLTVSWQDPANTVPTSVQAEVAKVGTNLWSEPLIVQPKTGKVVFHGLENNTPYKVRITTVLNSVGSTGIVLDNSGSGYLPRAEWIVPSVPKIVQHPTNSQSFSILGTNTRFTSGTDMTVRLYSPNNTDVSNLLSGLSVNSQNRINLTLKQSLDPGVYKLVLTTRNDGQLSTSLEIVTSNPSPVLTTSDTLSANYGYTSFTMNLVGNGFTSNSIVTIDGSTSVQTINYTDAQHLSFTMPSGLLPGLHKITVTTGGSSSAPLGFNVHPFKATASLTVPNMRNGAYRAELSVQNLDINSRGGKVLVIVRRNGVFMESKTFDNTYTGYETKSLKFDFGGTNTPYADGPTKTISIQAFVVDSYNLSPVSEPVVKSIDLNL